ncbi:MAG: phosphoribosyl-ATP diphosphatase [Oscillospiraceae bacterium]|jgi:phosphoribosyl-ATP pyrophosphohydrolase|nr:phosphoribosyl-ATP diphosphatase [Oscillospiraceae bacterium]
MDAFQDLYDTILERRENPQEGSYTCYLFAQGLDKILKKLGEECAETLIAAKNGEKSEIIAELSDLAFHAAVLMVQTGVTPGEVAAELEKRSAKQGNLKQFHVVDKNT